MESTREAKSLSCPGLFLRLLLRIVIVGNPPRTLSPFSKHVAICTCPNLGGRGFPLANVKGLIITQGCCIELLELGNAMDLSQASYLFSKIVLII